MSMLDELEAVTVQAKQEEPESAPGTSVELTEVTAKALPLTAPEQAPSDANVVKPADNVAVVTPEAAPENIAPSPESNPAEVSASFVHDAEAMFARNDVVFDNTAPADTRTADDRVAIKPIQNTTVPIMPVARQVIEVVDKEEKPEAKETEQEKKDGAQIIDISSLTINTNVDAISQNKDILNALGSSSINIEVYLPVSGYSAVMSRLNHSDAVRLFDQDDDIIGQMTTMYKIIFSKSNKFSFKTKPSFREWSEMTSILDIDTLLYGIYLATFNKEEITLSCNNLLCDKNEFTTKDYNLIISDAAKFGKLVERTQSSFNDISAVKANSIVTKGIKDGVILKDSKFVVNFRNASVAEHLDMLEMIKINYPESLESADPCIDLLMYTGSILVPVAGSSGYSKLTDNVRMFSILSKLTIRDTSTLQAAIDEHNQSETVGYSVTDGVCPKCGKVAEPSMVSMNRILYSAVYKALG